MPSANKDEPEIHAEAGTPDQLPAGQATEANRGLVDARTSAAASQAPNTSSSPQAAQAGSQGQEQPIVPFRPASEEDKFLFGPTQRPNEPVDAGITQSGRVAPPPDLASHPGMALLMQAAQAPGASPQVQALAQTMAHFMAGAL